MPAAILRRFSTGAGSKPSPSKDAANLGQENSLAGGHSGSSFEDTADASFIKRSATTTYRAPVDVAKSRQARSASLTHSITRSISRKLSLSHKPPKEPEFDETKQYYYQPAPEVDSANVVASKEMDAHLQKMLVEGGAAASAGSDANLSLTDITEAVNAAEASSSAIEEELDAQLKSFERLLTGHSKKHGAHGGPRDITDVMNDSQTSLNTKLQALEDVVASDFRQYL